MVKEPAVKIITLPLQKLVYFCQPNMFNSFASGLLSDLPTRVLTGTTVRQSGVSSCTAAVLSDLPTRVLLPGPAIGLPVFGRSRSSSNSSRSSEAESRNNSRSRSSSNSSSRSNSVATAVESAKAATAAMDTRLKKSKKLLEKEKDDFETTYCDGVDSIYDYVNELNRSKVSGGNLAKYSNEANTYFKSAEALALKLNEMVSDDIEQIECDKKTASKQLRKIASLADELRNKEKYLQEEKDRKNKELNELERSVKSFAKSVKDAEEKVKLAKLNRDIMKSMPLGDFLVYLTGLEEKVKAERKNLKCAEKNLKDCRRKSERAKHDYDKIRRDYGRCLDEQDDVEESMKKLENKKQSLLNMQRKLAQKLKLIRNCSTHVGVLVGRTEVVKKESNRFYAINTLIEPLRSVVGQLVKAEETDGILSIETKVDEIQDIFNEIKQSAKASRIKHDGKSALFY